MTAFRGCDLLWGSVYVCHLRESGNPHATPACHAIKKRGRATSV